MFCRNANRRITSEPRRTHSHPACAHGRLVNFLSKDDSIKSLLHWVVSGLDELDEQSRQAEQVCLAKARGNAGMYPSYHAAISPKGASTSDLPLDPAQIAEDNLAAAAKGSEGQDTDFSAGNMDMLSSTTLQAQDEDILRRARSALSHILPGVA
jgi:SIT4-associating protein SAP185/190